MQKFALRNMAFCLKLMEGQNVPYSVFFPAPSLYMQWAHVFSELTVTFENKNRHKRSLGYSSFDIIISKS